MNRANVEDVYKLSPIQQGILFHAEQPAGRIIRLNHIAGFIQRQDGRRAGLDQHTQLFFGIAEQAAATPLTIITATAPRGPRRLILCFAMSPLLARPPTRKKAVLSSV